MITIRGVTVGSLETSVAFKKNHPALANRLEGIASSLFPRRQLTIGDDSERLLADRAATVSVSRSDRPGLSRTASRARLAYRDPLSEATFAALRSEEHTSELQSRENLVCRLLLEKKKKRD